MQLREYQTRIINELRSLMSQGNKSVVLQLPTGAGKTVLAGEIVSKALDKSKRVFFIVHRKELLDQSAETFRRFGLPYGRVESGKRVVNSFDLQVCSIGTLVNRLDELKKPDMIILDECHH